MLTFIIKQYNSICGHLHGKLLGNIRLVDTPLGDPRIADHEEACWLCATHFISIATVKQDN